MIINEKALERVNKFRVGEKTESDHLPLEIELKLEIYIEKEETERSHEEEGEEERCREEKTETIIWDKEAIQVYRKEAEEWELDGESCSAEESWIKLKEKILNALVKRKMKKRKKKLGDRERWDKDCKRMKREVKRSYKRWKNGDIIRERYIEEKKKLKEICIEKHKRGKGGKQKKRI